MDEYSYAALGGQGGEGGDPGAAAGEQANNSGAGLQQSVDNPENHAAPGGQGGEGGDPGAAAGGQAEKGGDGNKKPASFAQGPSAEARAARLTAQRETEARLRREFDAVIAESDVPNPYTGRPFETAQEFVDYSRRRKADELAKRATAEKRPLSELVEEDEARTLIKKQKREQAEQVAQAKKAAELDAFLRADAQSFRAAYPDVDIAALEADKRFQRFSKGRLYKEPLAEIYSDYQEFAGEARAAAAAKAEQKEQKAQRGTGSGGGGQGGEQLSTRQQTELDEYNRRFPEKKMTAKEFLSWI